MIVLDTHVLAWADNDERKLGRKTRALINRLWARGEVAACAMSFQPLRAALRFPVRYAAFFAPLLRGALISNSS